MQRDVKKDSIIPVTEMVVRWGLPFLVVVVPLAVSARVDLHVVKNACLHLVVLVLATAWLLRMNQGSKIEFTRTSLGVPIIVFLVWSFVSLFKAQNISLGISALAQMVSLNLLYFVVVNNVGNERGIKRIIAAMAATAFLVSVYGILQSQGIDFGTWAGDAPTRRGHATLGNPNFAAQFLIATIPLVAGAVFITKGIVKRFLLPLVLVSMTVHLFLTKSVGSWAGALASCVVVGFLIVRRHMGETRRRGADGANKGIKRLSSLLKRKITVAVVLTSAAACVAVVTFSSVKRDLTREIVSTVNPYGLSTLSRLSTWNNTVELILENPLSGVGIGNFEVFIPAHWGIFEQEKFVRKNKMIKQVHNEYLEIASETGIVGSGIFLWLLCTIGVLSYSLSLKVRERELRVLTLACIGSIVAVLVNALFSFPLQNPASAVYFWSAVGFVGVIEKRVKASGIQTSRSGGESSFDSLRHKLHYYVVWGVALGILFTGTIYGLKPVRANFYHRAGLELLNQGEAHESIPKFEAALKFDPGSYMSLFSAGVAYQLTGTNDEAISHYRKCLAVFPYYYIARSNLGFCYLDKGDLSRALDAFKEVLAKVPIYWQARAGVALSYQRMNRFDEAIHHYRKALEIEYTDVGLHLNLAHCYEREGLDGLAENEYRTSVGISPNDPRPHYGLGELYLGQGKYEAAQRALLKTVALDPVFAPAHLSLAQLYLEFNIDVEKAAYHVAEYSRLRPNDEAARRLAHQVGNLYEIESANLASEVRARIRFNIGSALFYQNDIETAIVQFQEALKLVKLPGSVSAACHLYLGMAYNMQQRYELAERHFQLARASEPGISLPETSGLALEQ